MKEILKELRIAMMGILALAVLYCGIYPAVIWGLAMGLFPDEAGGSLIQKEGRALGSRLIGQAFLGENYFHPRPSAAGSGYDAAQSGGSNLGPLSRKLIDAVGQRVKDYRKENHLPETIRVPVDAVTASGSGLDPHISVANANLQAARVARARGLNEGEIEKLIDKHTEGRDFGILGEPRVNVMMLNLDLDNDMRTHGGK